MDSTNKDVFVGRDAELKALTQAWESVKNRSPQLVVLKGESGYGKTRLVQELYREIVSTLDDESRGYWPESLRTGGNPVRINPELEDTPSNLDMPFLWWGIRWSDPKGNEGAEKSLCRVVTALEQLEPHKEHLQRLGKKLERGFQAGMQLASVADSLFSAGLVTKAFQAFEACIDMRESAQIGAEEKKARIIGAESHAGQAKLRKSDQLDVIQTFLESVLSSSLSKSMVRTMPVVLILDDAQWSDSLSLKFIRILFEEAKNRQWPLLIVATHWEGEWLEHEQSFSGYESFAAVYNSLRDTFGEESDTHLHTIDCTSIENLSPLVRNSLAGLSQESQGSIVRLSGGIPGLQHQIIDFLKSNSHFFENDDVFGELKPGALDKLSEKNMDLHNYIQKKRFEAVTVDIQRLLGYASYYGMQFLSDFIIDVCGHIDKQHSFGENSLKKSVNPYAILIKEGVTVYGFRSRVHLKVASDYRKEVVELTGIDLDTAFQFMSIKWLKERRHRALQESEKHMFLLTFLGRCWNSTGNQKVCNDLIFDALTELARSDYEVIEPLQEHMGWVEFVERYIFDFSEERLLWKWHTTDWVWYFRLLTKIRVGRTYPPHIQDIVTRCEQQLIYFIDDISDDHRFDTAVDVPSREFHDTGPSIQDGEIFQKLAERGYYYEWEWDALNVLVDDLCELKLRVAQNLYITRQKGATEQAIKQTSEALSLQQWKLNNCEICNENLLLRVNDTIAGVLLWEIEVEERNLMRVMRDESEHSTRALTEKYRYQDLKQRNAEKALDLLGGDSPNRKYFIQDTSVIDLDEVEICILRANCHCFLGNIQKLHAELEMLYQDARGRYKKTTNPSIHLHQMYLIAICSLANLCCRNRQFKEAYPYLSSAKEVLQSLRVRYGEEKLSDHWEFWLYFLESDICRDSLDDEAWQLRIDREFEFYGSDHGIVPESSDLLRPFFCRVSN